MGPVHSAARVGFLITPKDERKGKNMPHVNLVISSRRNLEQNDRKIIQDLFGSGRGAGWGGGA